MSFAAVCAWACLRSLAVAVVSLVPAWGLCRLLTEMRSGARRAVWVLILAPFFVPDVLVGYAYANAAWPSRVLNPAINETWYVMLLLFKSVPVATVLLYFSPPSSLSAEAFHCRRLALETAPRRWSAYFTLAGVWLRGRARACLPAFAIVYVFAFQEFELAARLEVIVQTMSTPVTWTIRVFDAQVGGLPVGESLKLTLLPVLLLAAVLVPVLLVLATDRRKPVSAAPATRRLSKPGRLGTWIYLALAVAAMCAVPAWLVIEPAGEGLVYVVRDFAQAKGRVQSVMEDIGTSVLFSIAGGIGGYWASGWLIHRDGRRGMPVGVLGLSASAPGLFGTLVLSLAVLYVIQFPGIRVVYDNDLPLLPRRVLTSLPLTCALVLWLLPRGVLLHVLLRGSERAEPVHLAGLLRRSPSGAQRESGRELIWQMESRGRFWACALLCYWAYWDVTAPAILMPIGLTATTVRLYNLMHYSQTQLLSAMLAATMLAPLLLLLLAAGVRRPILRLLDRSRLCRISGVWNM